jgi:hypothetical protein
MRICKIWRHRLRDTTSAKSPHWMIDVIRFPCRSRRVQLPKQLIKADVLRVFEMNLYYAQGFVATKMSFTCRPYPLNGGFFNFYRNIAQAASSRQPWCDLFTRSAAPSMGSIVT